MSARTVAEAIVMVVDPVTDILTFSPIWTGSGLRAMEVIVTGESGGEQSFHANLPAAEQETAAKRTEQTRRQK